jgi:hypothetical protein
MPCSFGLLLHPRSAPCAQPIGLLEVTVSVRYIPLVTAAYGTRMARPASRTRLLPGGDGSQPPGTSRPLRAGRAAPWSLTNNDHAPALQDGSVAADHSKEQVEVQQWAGSLELGGASTAGRRGQRPDCHEIGARTDAIGRRCIDGPGDGEGCVRGSILDVTLTWATKVSTLVAGRRDDDLTHPLAPSRPSARFAPVGSAWG